MVPLLTLNNAVELLGTDKYLDFGYIYSWSSTKYWYTRKEMRVRLSEQYGNALLTIPTGFCTDLSSVPRGLWSVYSPYGDFLLAAIIHDFLYVQNIGTRAMADKEMLIWSNVVNSDHKINNYIRYSAVRVFGKSWWNKSKDNTEPKLHPLYL